MARSGKILRVLVVDDHRDGADALGLLVEELGNQVHVTYGGPQALDVANTFRPDLMLVDLLMPGMDGCGLVMRLRQNPAFAQTTIAAVTGQKDQEHKSLAMKAGFDTVLFKPVSRTEIKAVLVSALHVVTHMQDNRHSGPAGVRVQEPSGGQPDMPGSSAGARLQLACRDSSLDRERRAHQGD